MAFFTSEKRGDILFLTFEDLGSRNSFSIAAARELRSLLKSEKFEALVFAARGRVFSSGGNLSDYASMTSAEEGMRVNDEIRSVLAELASLPVPTVCAVGGDSFGGGVELVSCFDHVVAASHVVFALWQRKISLTYGWGGGSRLERRMGSAQLRNLSLSARAIGSSEAKAIGLVDEVCVDSELLARATATAAAMTGLPKAPLASFKSFDSASEVELFNSLWWNESHLAVLNSRKR